MSFGTSADAAVIDPTAQASFMSIAKGILKTIIDSGTAAIDNVLGAIDDAAVTTDASATITARLRGLVNLISALNAKTPDIAGQTFDATALVDQLALTTSADTSSQLSNGVYRICSTADCYILQADSDAGTDLATYANGHFLGAGLPEFIAVTGATNDYLAALVTVGTGVLTISGPF